MFFLINLKCHDGSSGIFPFLPAGGAAAQPLNSQMLRPLRHLWRAPWNLAQKSWISIPSPTLLYYSVVKVRYAYEKYLLWDKRCVVGCLILDHSGCWTKIHNLALMFPHNCLLFICIDQASCVISQGFSPCEHRFEYIRHTRHSMQSPCMSVV